MKLPAEVPLCSAAKTGSVPRQAFFEGQMKKAGGATKLLPNRALRPVV